VSPAGVIRVVIFDLDDTLFAHRAAVRDGIAAHVARELGTVDATALQDRWDDLEELHYHRYLSGELTYLGQRHSRARDFMRPLGVEFVDDAAAEEWFETYLVEYRRAWTLYPDTLPCLDALGAAGVRIGMITNGVLGFQLAKLDAMGLTERIEHVVTSGEFGYAKPDPRIFLHACTVFGVAPSEAAYVGDRLRTDAIGAADAGLAGVWLNRSGETSAEDDAAVAASRVGVIDTLAELPALVRRI
jgi:putative hydrolase of the HAD superfamily